MILRTLFFFLSLVVVHSHNVIANDQYPDLPIQITALDLTLQFENQLVQFNAKAEYTMRVNREDVLSFNMTQTDLKIRSVKIYDKEIPFQVFNDTIRIGLRESFPKNTEFKLHIEYQALVGDAFFQSTNNIYWSSGFNFDTQKLLPVINHPRIRFRTTIRAIHPSEFHFVSNGAFISRSRHNETQSITLYENRSLISFSGLRFVLGQLQVLESNVGALPIRFYLTKSDSNLERINRLTPLFEDEINRLSTTIRFPYPFDALNVIILPESYGQEWGDGAGIGYLFDDYGSLDDQLKLIISSQWLRQHLRSSDPQVEEFLTIYTQALAQVNTATFLQPSSILRNRSTELDRLSPLRMMDKTYFDNFKLSDIQFLFETERNLITNFDLEEARYQDQWYPRPLPIKESSSAIVNLDEASSEIKPGFFIKINRTEVAGEIQFQFDSFGEHLKSEYEVHITSYSESKLDKQVIRMSSSDSIITLDLGLTLQNVIIEFDDAHFLEVLVDKPFGFWLYQYRNIDEFHLKADAARALAGFASHQDLGLLVRDEIIQKETDEYLSMIYQLWAPGDTNYSFDYEKWLYEDLETKDRTRLYRLITEQLSIDRLTQLSLGFLNRTNSWDIHNLLIRKVFKESEVKEAIAFSESFLSTRYPYELRQTVFKELERYDQSSKNWLNRLPDLVIDQDPRIRLLALMNSRHLNNEQKKVLFRDRKNKERDPRILTYLSQSDH